MRYKQVATSRLLQEINNVQSGVKKADITIIIDSTDPVDEETEYTALIRSISPDKIKYNKDTDMLSIIDWLYDITIPRVSGIVVYKSIDNQSNIKTVNYMIEFVNSTFTFQFNYV